MPLVLLNACEPRRLCPSSAGCSPSGTDAPSACAPARPAFCRKRATLTGHSLGGTLALHDAKAIVFNPEAPRLPSPSMRLYAPPSIVATRSGIASTRLGATLIP